LPWEYHDSYRLRNTIYPLFHAIPLYILKELGLDSNTAVRLCPYIVHSVFVITGDVFLWRIGKETVGKHATQVAFVFYLTNRVQNSLIIRCFTNSIEEILTTVGFFFYSRVGAQLNKAVVVFTAIVSIQFMMRNTSPIGWIPLLFIKVFQDGAFKPFFVCAVFVALPIVVGSTYLDSVYYSQGKEFEWTFTGLNFLRVNLVEGLSKYFGDHPWWFYLAVFGPAMFTVIYPFVIHASYFYTKQMIQIGKRPEIMYVTFFYVFVFSVIGHKEKRFLLPVFAFCVLVVGYLLVHKIKTWKRKVAWIIYLSVFVELSI
jgi:GPI mannosyltransferase 3